MRPSEGWPAGAFLDAGSTSGRTTNLDTVTLMRPSAPKPKGSSRGTSTRASFWSVASVILAAAGAGPSAAARRRASAAAAARGARGAAARIVARRAVFGAIAREEGPEARRGRGARARGLVVNRAPREAVARPGAGPRYRRRDAEFR